MMRFKFKFRGLQTKIGTMSSVSRNFDIHFMSTTAQKGRPHEERYVSLCAVVRSNLN